MLCLPCRASARARIAKLGGFEAPQTAFVHGRNPSARGGNKLVSAELLAMQGHKQQAMTLHKYALESVDGSLISLNEDSEHRWSEQVLLVLPFYLIYADESIRSPRKFIGRKLNENRF